jgi:chromosome segregation ATPase
MSQEVIDIYKELAENGIKENAYAELEQNYHQLVNEIGNDSSTERFRDEIDKLYRTFQVAMANEKILIRMLKELKKKYQDDAGSLNKIREQQREERKELENVYKKLQELQKQQQISNLEKKEYIVRSELSVSDKIKDDYAVDEGKIEDLEKEKMALQRTLEQAQIAYERLQKDLSDLSTIKERHESKIKDLEGINKDLSQKIENEMQMNNKKIGEKDIEISQLKAFNTKQIKDIEDSKNTISTLQILNEEANSKLSETKKVIDELRMKKLELEIIVEKQAKKIEDDKKEKKLLHEREKTALDTVKQLEEEKEKLERRVVEKENGMKERNRLIDKINKERSELEVRIQELEGEINLKKQEIDKYKSLRNEEARQKDQEKIISRKKESELKKKLDEISELETAIHDFRGDNKSLSENLMKLKEELSKASKLNGDLEKSRDKVTEENTKLKNKIDHLLEDIRLRDNRVQELQKKVSESEKKMKMQREVYDAVRRDKNLYFKNLIETQDDLIDKQNLLQFNKKEIENLKSDLKKKDDYIVNLKSKNSNFEDLLKTKQLENDKLKVEFEGLKQICATQEKEIEKLKFEGLERAKDYKKVDAEYKKTIIDRDNISSQLIRRNDEVSLLHEKIMILTSDLSRSEREFQETKELINKYIRENRNLLRELEISKNFKLEAKNFAKEIINLNKELLREKNLVK